MSKCKEWTGTMGADGYGRKWNASRNNWDQAHRWIWEQSNGPIPKGMLVRHLCHNRKCVNLEHLAIGDMKDNRQDDINAGKDWFIGENNNKAKLTEQQVLDIRNDTRSLRKIAADYDMNFTTISDIKKRKTWKHI